MIGVEALNQFRQITLFKHDRSGCNLGDIKINTTAAGVVVLKIRDEEQYRLVCNHRIKHNRGVIGNYDICGQIELINTGMMSHIEDIRTSFAGSSISCIVAVPSDE